MATIVIGIDGANWEMVRPWLEDGTLPTLSRLVEEGIGGPSRSTLPPLTVPNWKCYATGKYPGKLDVFRFDRIDTDRREHVFHDATDFRSPELWDYLNDAGLRAGVVNKPSTYPPREIDGFVVAGGPDATDGEYRSVREQFATPSSVDRFLREELDYRVHPSPLLSPGDTGPAEIAAALDAVESRFEAAAALLRREQPEFLHVTAFYNMALQHYFWRDEPVRRVWKRIDDQLGRFVDEGHNLVVMSDHGTEHVDAVFYVNTWLAEHGYLSVERTLDEHLRRLGVTRERALEVAKRLGVVETMARLVPETLQKRLPWQEGIKRERVLDALDWSETQAVASSQGPIYLTADRGTATYRRVREQLVDELGGLEHPETGAPLVTAVHRGEEYYDGPYAEHAPDLLLEQAPGVHASDAIGPSEWYSETGVWRGGNMPTGVFLMHGPAFRAEGLTASADIVDLAPTLLHLLGLRVPTDLDGEVLDVFAPGSDPARRPVRTRPPLGSGADAASSPGEDRGVEQRLEDLGYLE
jgi:predicted AlkP superfamily phosphohydrolase/phosphomutase